MPPICHYAGRLLILLSACLYSASYGFAEQSGHPVTLIYSGNLNGELEPCGCTKDGDLGGLRRRATMVAQLRRQYPDLFLISSGGLLAIDSATDRIKNKYILKALRKLDYDAIGVQQRDLVFGPELLTSEQLPWVASNRGDDSFRSSRRITHNKTSLSFFSWMNPQNVLLHKMQAKPITAKRGIQLMLKDIRRAKQQGDLIVLTTSQPLAEIQKSIDLENIDILLIRAAHEVYGPPQQIGHTLVLQPGSRGMRLGYVDILVNRYHRIQSYQHHVIPLPTSIAEAADMSGWYEEYNAELKQDYLKRVELRKAAETGQSPYAGADQCRPCHQAAWQGWQNSRHARAFASLEKVGKSFDPNCVGCHSVGFEKTGGFIDNQLTGRLENVQCESCHGAGQAHVTSNGTAPLEHKGWPKEKICRQCHVGSHSPSFSVQKYWPKVAH